MPYVLAFALTMLLAAVTLPRTSGQFPCAPLCGMRHVELTGAELSIVSFVYFWFFLAAITGAYIWGNVSHLFLHRPCPGRLLDVSNAYASPTMSSSVSQVFHPNPAPATHDTLPPTSS